MHRRFWIPSFQVLAAALVGLALSCDRARPSNSALTVSDRGVFHLQAEPGERGAPIRQLEPGERLADLDSTTFFTTAIRVGDTLLQAHWLQVRGADGNAGWVFGGALSPTEGDAEEWLLRKKMDAFLGKNLARKAIGWANAMENAQTDEHFAEAFREGAALRERINAALAARRERNEAAQTPDFFWLNGVVPGYFVQMVDGLSRPHLFADYRHFREIAAQTAGEQDDFFIAACLAAFPADSLESLFPVWKMQTAPDAGCSNLGAGAHLKMLAAIDRALGAGDFFAPELLAMKDCVLDDFLDKNAAFWQPKNLIAKELGEMLAFPCACLTARDRIAMTERFRILKSAEANGVRVNLRSF